MTSARYFLIVGAFTAWPAIVVGVAFLLAWVREGLAGSRNGMIPSAKSLIGSLFPANLLCPILATAIGVLIVVPSTDRTPIHSAVYLFFFLCLFLFWPLYICVGFFAPLTTHWTSPLWKRSSVSVDYRPVSAVLMRMFAITAALVAVELCWLLLPMKSNVDF